MKLTLEQRKIGIKYNMMIALATDIYHQRYTELQQLYEALNLKTNDKLVKKLNEERNIGDVFTATVYTDALLVIADYLDARTDIVELFDLLCEKRYPYIKKMFLEWENQYKKNGTIKKKNIKEVGIPRNYLYFLFYKSETFLEPDQIIDGFNYKQDAFALRTAFYTTDKDPFKTIIKFYQFKDGERVEILSSDDQPENVISSKYFERYLLKRRSELAQYLKVEEKNLAEYIHSQMKSHSKDGMAEVRAGNVGLIETITKNIIADQNGGTSWYNAMTTTDNSKEFGRKIQYVPDVNRLIRNYFESYVVTQYIERMQQKADFNKITLARDCIPENYEMVYQTILCMYEMDVLYKMFAIMQQQYYHDFSWEKITNQSIVKRYEEIVANLEMVVGEKENKINILAQKCQTLSLQITAENSKQTAPLVAENNKLLKIIEDRDAKINDLKMQLESQEQFINALNRQDTEFDEENGKYDLEILQSKRYLFVGHIEAVLPDLKYKFPNSIFMETETMNLAGIEVDAVVMLIKWMSHSMFYKIKSIENLRQAKIVICNTKNINTILQKIYDEVIC